MDDLDLAILEEAKKEFFFYYYLIIFKGRALSKDSLHFLKNGGLKIKMPPELLAKQIVATTEGGDYVLPGK